MKTRLLFRKALYRSMRTEIGYYDARRIMRSLDNYDVACPDTSTLKDYLEKSGHDSRQIDVVISLINKIEI